MGPWRRAVTVDAERLQVRDSSFARIDLGQAFERPGLFGLRVNAAW